MFTLIYAAVVLFAKKDVELMVMGVCVIADVTLLDRWVFPILMEMVK